MNTSLSVASNKRISVGKTSVLAISTLFIMLVTGMGCSNKRLKTLGAIIVVGVAAKLIYDMVIDYQTKQITNEDKVIDNYKKTHKKLPEEPVLVSYQSSIKPGEVVKAGNDISIVSTLEVVRSASSRNVEIQEKIIIFDNEDNSKELKSLVKTVNDKTNNSGAFANEFTFKLPKGMPQGIYPIKTLVIVNGKEYAPKDNRMQLVLNSAPEGDFELFASFR